jgi:hypothetical protein
MRPTGKPRCRDKHIKMNLEETGMRPTGEPRCRDRYIKMNLEETGMRPTGEPRCRDRYIKMNLEVTGCEDTKCINIVQGRNQLRAMVNMVMKICPPPQKMIFLTR